jgi:tetratricopeptide (TPR) repeat protein
MGLEVALRFVKPPLKAEIADLLGSVEGTRPNGERGLRWENEELEGFFTIDWVEPVKNSKRKPKVEGVDIHVPWGGPSEEIQMLVSLLDSLAGTHDAIVTSSVSQGQIGAGQFDAIPPAWHQANVEALVRCANQSEMSIRQRRERFDEDDTDRVEVIDASQLSVDPDQREIYQCNCALRIAQALQRCGEHKLAIVTSHRVIERLPEDQFAHVLLGISFSSLGDNETARQVYKRAIDIDPDGQYADYAQAMLESVG